MKNMVQLALLAAIGSLSAIGVQAQQPSDSTSQNNPQPSTAGSTGAAAPASSAGKANKVWTEDDIHNLGGVSVIGSGKTNQKTKSSSRNNSKDGTAENYKTQLAKLQAQLDETNKKLVELRNFNGDNSPDTAIQRNHGLSRASVAEQIAKLETKKKQIETQMQNIFDQARRSGIEPGALR